MNACRIWKDTDQNKLIRTVAKLKAIVYAGSHLSEPDLGSESSLLSATGIEPLIRMSLNHPSSSITVGSCVILICIVGDKERLPINKFVGGEVWSAEVDGSSVDMLKVVVGGNVGAIEGRVERLFSIGRLDGHVEGSSFSTGGASFANEIALMFPKMSAKYRVASSGERLK